MITPNHIAILLYGSMSYVLIAVLAFRSGDTASILMIILAVVTTYVMQCAQEFDPGKTQLAVALWVLAVMAAATSIVLSLTS